MFISCTKLIMLKTPSTHSKSTMMSPCSKEIKQQHLNPILFPYFQHCIYTHTPSGSILFAYCYHNNFCNILHCWWKISVWGENLQKMVVKLVALEAPLLLPVHMIFKQCCQEWYSLPHLYGRNYTGFISPLNNKLRINSSTVIYLPVKPNRITGSICGNNGMTCRLFHVFWVWNFSERLSTKSNFM